MKFEKKRQYLFSPQCGRENFFSATQILREINFGKFSEFYDCRFDNYSGSGF